MNSFQVRTDLAVEARESVESTGEQMRGVRVEEYAYEKEAVAVTKVFIETKNAANQLGKPMGIYVTMEAENLGEPDEGYHAEIAGCLSKELIGLLDTLELGEESAILVVGLGNRDVTADALGPRVLDNLYVTRHLVRLYGKAAVGDGANLISCIEPGVMAKTGMETAEIISGVVKETKPDVILVIDALAARSVRRLNRTIQITNTGIQPGSGVGNHRNALTEESLSVPVIAIGVPTVVDAATIVNDALESLMESEKAYWRNSFTDLNNMYVTGKDVDEIVKRVSFTISEGINAALNQGGHGDGSAPKQKGTKAVVH